MGPLESFDRPMSLLDEVVQIPGLAQLDGRAAVGHQAMHGRSVGTALVDRYLLWHVVPIDGTFEESARRGHIAVSRQPEFHRLAESVNCPV